jgi:hypothetical protein
MWAKSLALEEDTHAVKLFVLIVTGGALTPNDFGALDERGVFPAGTQRSNGIEVPLGLPNPEVFENWEALDASLASVSQSTKPTASLRRGGCCIPMKL